MPSLTRRRALLGAASLLGGLAGCNDAADPGDAAPSPTPTVRDRARANVATDPDYLVYRASDTDEPLVWFARPDAVPTDGTVAQHDRERSGFIASEATAETLHVAAADAVSLPEPQNAPNFTNATTPADVRAFVAATDFDSETLYLVQRSIDECRRRLLCYVSWDDGEFETHYGDFLRAHDAACETEAEDRVAMLVRVPAAFDPESMREGSSGISRGDCFASPAERDRRHRDGDETTGTATTAPNGTATVGTTVTDDDGA